MTLSLYFVKFLLSLSTVMHEFIYIIIFIIFFLETLPDALKSGCSKCDVKQKAMADKVINHLRTKRINDWERLIAKYDPTGEYKKRFETTRLA